jgi:hypothetical protein
MYNSSYMFRHYIAIFRDLINVLRAQSDTKIILHWDNRLIPLYWHNSTFINYLNDQSAFLLLNSKE